MISLSVLTIATNRYLDYWFDFHSSLLSTQKCNQLTIYLFTDRIQDQRLTDLNSPFNVIVVPIPSLTWPAATLLRFHLFNLILESVDTSHILYVDSDSIVKKDLIENFKLFANNGLISCVKHPGFTLELRNRHTKRWLKYLKFLIIERGFGTWEKNFVSCAYVPPSLRKNYVCGGVIFGGTSKFFEMSKKLAGMIERDIHSGIIARWHDESYLNHFASFSKVNLLDSNFCFDARDLGANNDLAIIVAVEKGDNRTR